MILPYLLLEITAIQSFELETHNSAAIRVRGRQHMLVRIFCEVSWLYLIFFLRYTRHKSITDGSTYAHTPWTDKCKSLVRALKKCCTCKQFRPAVPSDMLPQMKFQQRQTVVIYKYWTLYNKFLILYLYYHVWWFIPAQKPSLWANTCWGHMKYAVS